MDKYEYWWMSVHNEFLPADISRGLFSYEEIYKMSEGSLKQKLSLTASQAEYVSSVKNTELDKRYDEFIQSGVKSVTVNDDEYPARLRNIDDKPYALFYLGELPDENKKSIAIIGSRSCSEYGRVMAERLAANLAKSDVSIISGMALGIDGIAQMHALNAGGRSYGVLGGSVLECYPNSNRILYERLKNNGGVISEYALNVPSKPAFFPKRNRLISGLSDGVIVVQAKIRSGTFITVDCALSQGRDVMVVPGMVTDPLSVGCNLLIMQGAYPVQCAEDVMHILNSSNNSSVKYNNTAGEHNKKRRRQFKLVRKLPSELKESKITAPLTKEEELVYNSLNYSLQSTEEISELLNMEMADVLKPLIMLELKGLIKECGKGVYSRST